MSLNAPVAKVGPEIYKPYAPPLHPNFEFAAQPREL
jgi:hypothetical protein